MQSTVSSFSIQTVSTHCHCGGHYTRIMNYQIQRSLPVCSICEAPPATYLIKKTVNRERLNYSFFKSGKRLYTAADCAALNDEIDADIANGTFCRDNYCTPHYVARRDSFGMFLINNVLKSEKSATLLKPEESEYVEEFLVPYFIDTPYSKAKISDFIEDFGITKSNSTRRVNENYVKSLYSKLLNFIGQQEQGVA